MTGARRDGWALSKLWLTVALSALLAPRTRVAGSDSDGDLLPDDYERAHGLNPASAADADLDPDGDRLTNLDEFFAGTDSRASDVRGDVIYTDRQLLRLLQGRAFRFFWLAARPPYFFTPDNGTNFAPLQFSRDFDSIAGTGFSLAAYVAADENGWIEPEQAVDRIVPLLRRAVELQAGSYDVRGAGISNGRKGNRHGHLYHFVTDQGTRAGQSEVSNIDHALFVAGALAAGEYYRGTEVEDLARELYLNTDWNWLFDGSYLRMAWLEDPAGSFEGGRLLDSWNRYSELIILLALALGNTDAAKGVPAAAWERLGGFPNEVRTLRPGDLGFVDGVAPYRPGISNAGRLTYLHAGSLHTHQYSQLFLDLRHRPDRYGNDYFVNSIAATLVNRAYCRDLGRSTLGAKAGDPRPFESYLPDLLKPDEVFWGLAAGLGTGGYQVFQPILPPDPLTYDNIARNNDSGSAFPFAPLGSLPFAPREVLDFARLLYRRWFDRAQGYYPAVWGPFGFLNGFNTGKAYNGQAGHYAMGVIALDLGTIVGMVENHLTGLFWRTLVTNRWVQEGLRKMGMPTGAVEPFIINFDDSPPDPHEDPNGGGRDPHSFGGTVGSWGSGDDSAVYLAIADPFPEKPYGPQGWVIRIRSDRGASGGFVILSGHSVSNWGRVSFWVRGAAGGETVRVGLKDMDRVEAKVPLDDHHPEGRLTSQWREVRIPLEEFSRRGVRLTALDNVSFTFDDPGGGTIFVDDIAFLGDELPPSRPEGLSASVSAGAVTLRWARSPEPDVVGYNVYRRAGAAGLLEKLTPFLVAGAQHLDAAPPQKVRLQYRIEAVDRGLAYPYGIGPNASPLSEPVEVTIGGDASRRFVRGDANGDGQVDISDAIRVLGFLFAGDDRPEPLDAADSNDDGGVDISDAVTVLELLFLGSRSSLPPPYPDPGLDPTADGL